MLRKLIIAVFVLGLTMTLSGTALSDVITDYSDAPTSTLPSAPRYQTGFDDPIAANQQVLAPAQRIDQSQVRSAPSGTVAPQPPAAACGYEFYHNGGISSFFMDPDYLGASFNVVLNNVRFTVPDPTPGSGIGAIEDTVKAASLLMYLSATVGDPAVRFYLYDSDGFGFPGSKLDSVDVPFASWVPTGDGFSAWADGTFPNEWVFVDGEEYHIAFSVVQNSADDSLAFLTDDGTGHAPTQSGVARNLHFLAGTGFDFWIQSPDLWAGNVDFGIFLESFVCRAEIPFSDCFFQGYYDGLAFVWGMPNVSFGDEQYSMRFDVTGQDTLVAIEFPIYDGTGAPFAPPGYIFGDDDITVDVYGDDGTGLPDESNVLFSTVVPGTTYPAFPAWISVPVGIVVEETYHVAIGSSEIWAGAGMGDTEYLLSDDGTTPNGRSASDWGGNFWVSMLAGYGDDFDFLIEVFQCRDEFTECEVINQAGGITDAVYPVPDANPIIEWAQQYNVSGLECQLRDVTIGYSRSAAFDSARVDMYTDTTNIYIRSDAGGVPGAPISTILHLPADYASGGYTGPGFFGQFNVTTDLGGSPLSLPNTFWVGVEPQTALRDSGIRVQLNVTSTTGSGLVDGMFANAPAFGGWLDIADVFGWNQDAAMNSPITVCCIPIPRRPCSPGEDWFTEGHDYNRSFASQNALGDAWCDLTVNWTYEDATGGVNFTGPTVYDDKVICAFGDHYIQFDLATGAQNWTVGPVASLIGASLRCPPLIVETTAFGTVAFVTGGDQLSIAVLDWATGAIVSQRDFITDITDFGSNRGQTRFGAFMVLDIAGTETVFWTTDDGWIRAAELTAPQLTISWEVQLDPTFESGATDGNALYYCTQPATGDGDIYSIDPATGAINWQLSSAVGGGLQGNVVHTLYPGATEVFSTGVSLDNGNLYASSNLTLAGGAGGDFPVDGLLYKISATTGAVDFAVPTVSAPLYASPVHDIGQIFVPGQSSWINPPIGDVIAHSKNSGVVNWAYQNPDWPQVLTHLRSSWRNDGVLSCEGDGNDDLLFLLNNSGILTSLNARTGENVFERRFDRPFMGADGAIAVDDLTGDTHLIFANQWGDLTDFTQSADRPRLELLAYTFQTAVEFGASPSLPVSIGPVLTNTGCVDLNVADLVLDTDPSGVLILSYSSKTVSDDMLDRGTKIADILTVNSKKFKPFEAEQTFSDEGVVSKNSISFEREVGNRAAAAFPGFLNAPGYHGTSPVPGLVAPGDTAEVIFDVNQPLVQRGPNPFFMRIVSNDHDYWVQDGRIGTFGNTDGTPPEVSVTLIGGCLTDTTDLNFGIGGANFQVVSNSGRLADDVWGGADPGRYGINIDGLGDAFFAGAYLFGVTERRISINLHDVVGDDVDEFISWQPDPNWCDNECKPALEANVNLGSISTDGGATYTPITGNRVCASGIDSVQNFDDGLGGWDWTFGGDPQAAPFDNDSTMGFVINSRTVGALDVPELERVAVEVFEFTERNGNDLPDWMFSVWVDTDAGVAHGSGKDTMIISRDASAIWDTGLDPLEGPAYGFIKIPFGCVEGFDGTPIKNVVTLDTDNSMYSADRSYLDSAYLYAQRAPGEYSMPGAVAARDQSLHGTLVEHDFTAGETITFGIGVFGYELLSDPLSPANTEVAALSDIVNKWAGFGRGDVNNDQGVNLADIIYLADHVNAGGNGPYPFMHLGDVNADGSVDGADVQYLIDFYFCAGPCPAGAWMF